MSLYAILGNLWRFNKSVFNRCWLTRCISIEWGACAKGRFLPSTRLLSQDLGMQSLRTSVLKGHLEWVWFTLQFEICTKILIIWDSSLQKIMQRIDNLYWFFSVPAFLRGQDTVLLKTIKLKTIKQHFFQSNWRR